MPETGEFYVTPQIKADYEKFGYVLVRGLLSGEEMTKLKAALEQSKDIKKNAYGKVDGQGRQSKMTLWNYAGNDVTGVLARSQKVAGTMQALMGGDELYHYHTKLMMKDAKVGGAHIWHQDYGYWYQNGCLFPEMATVFMPVDKCTKANGCLRVLKGSHKLGRLDHVLVGEQATIEPQRMAEVEAVLPLVYVEMDPGDALFFGCNLVHTSSRNDSDFRRWAFLVAYNKRLNNPVREHHHAQYHPLNMLPNSAILECELFDSTEDKWYLVPTTDSSATSLKTTTKDQDQGEPK